MSKLLPEVSDCLPNSFWPVKLPELEEFVRSSQLDYSSNKRMLWNGSWKIPHEQLAKFPRFFRRCIPFHDPSCWRTDITVHERLSAPQTSCFYCCDPNLRKQEWHDFCFDDKFTEERCCNT